MEAIAYLPCELKARDLAPRMALANELVGRGLAVVVGQTWAISANLPDMAVGLYIGNTANEIQADIMAQAKRRGLFVIGADQEALPFSGQELLANIAPTAIEASDIFLAATENHRRIISKQYPNANVKLVGSPRIDLLRNARPPRPTAAPYILFNTGFGLVNSVWGDIETATKYLLKGGGIDLDEIKTRVRFEISARDNIVALIRWCASNLHQKIIVRPHPSEDSNAWQSLGDSRVTIVERADGIPWIAHADLIVHANSTTGLEAAIMGRPCINIVPQEFRHWASQFVIHEANVTVSEAKQAAELMRGSWKRLGPQKIPHFPKNSAGRIADLAKTLTDGSQPIGSIFKWNHGARSESQRAKFEVKLEEFQMLTKHPIGALDDSLVLITSSA